MAEIKAEITESTVKVNVTQNVIKAVVKDQGPAGLTGPAGPAGDQGADGVGVPSGGTASQVLRKASDNDFDTEWHTLVKANVGLENVENALQLLQSQNLGDLLDASAARTNLGLGNVDDTSDADKPVSAATQTALDLKVDENVAITGATKTKITYDAKGLVTAGADATQDDIGDGTTYKQYSATEKTKLAGIETGADVTDATNVAAAGAVMESDTSTASMSFVVDEDDMVSDSATKIPTQQSVKAYVDSTGGHAPVTVTDSSEIDFTLTGQDITASLKAGSIDETKLDVSVNASLDLADTAVQDLSDLSITATATELNYVDGVTSAIQTQLDAKAPLASPTFTGTVTLPVALTGVIRTDSGVVSVDTDVTDIVSAASDIAAGKVELATTAETTTGTDATRAVTPDGLHDMTSLAGAAWFLDEDDMVSNSATKTASQQSIKAYVDANIGGGSVDTSGTPVLNDFARFTDADTIEGRSYAEVKADLDLEIGTDIQAYSANLDEYSAVNPTAAGLALLDDADAAAQRTTLGLVAGGTGDIWAEKAGDTFTGAVVIDPGAEATSLTIISGTDETSTGLALRSNTAEYGTEIVFWKHPTSTTVTDRLGQITAHGNAVGSLVDEIAFYTTDTAGAMQNRFKVLANVDTTGILLTGAVGISRTSGNTIQMGTNLDGGGTNAFTFESNVRVGTYLRVGSTSAPTNTTAGDLTFVRGFASGNVVIDTDGVGPMLTLGDAAGADNDALLLLNIDRPWQFEQESTGATAALVLRSTNTDKAFRLQTSSNTTFVEFGASTSATTAAISITPQSSAAQQALFINQDKNALAISIDHDDTGTTASIDIDRDGNNAGEIKGLTIDVANAGAGSATALHVTAGTTKLQGTTFGATVTPASSDGAAIGTSSLMWSDLFLASGAVINFNNSNFTLTHSTGALTMSGGPLILAENSSIQLDPAGSADGKYTGITVTGTAGYTQSFGDLVYLDPTDSRWEAVDANSAAGADGDARGIIGMVVSAGTDGNACTILLQGIIRADAKFPTFTINNPIYASETAGSVTQTQPTTTDVVIRVVGFAITADEMYFNPSQDYITHT